jgi:hypothetical protein
MKRISVCCLVLGFLAAQATAYLVHEEPEEEVSADLPAQPGISNADFLRTAQ